MNFDLLFLNQLIIVLINIIGVWLGFWVYLSGKQRRPNQGFLLLVIPNLLWINFYNLACLPSQHHLALLWIRLTFASVFIFFISAYYFFILWFLNQKGWYLFLGKVILILSLLFSILSIFTNFIISSVKFEKWLVIPVFSNEGSFIFHGFVIFFTTLIIARLIFGYFKFSPEERLKIQYFLTGIFLFAITIFILGVILPFFFSIYKYYYLANYSTIFLLGFTAYAIVKRELFGIKVVLTTLLVGVMAIILLILPFLMPSIELKFLTSFVFSLFILFGYLLIKATHEEAKRREEAESLAYRERILRGEAESLARGREKMAEQFQVMAIRSEAMRKSEEEFARRAEESAKRERKLREEAEKLAKIKTEFMILSTHHWRTPLSEIKGKLSMILEKKFKELPEELWLELQKIYRSNERAIKTANQLIYLSQIELGEYPPNKKEVDLEELLGSSFLEGKIEAERKGLNFTFEKPKETLPKVFIDENQAGEIFKIILDNAVRYTQKGEIKVWTERKENSLLIAIKDSGAGIEKEALPLIFEGLAKGKAGYLYRMEGPGLNLYIAKRLVEQNKGKIWVESKGKSKGSTFYIQLPIR